VAAVNRCRDCGGGFPGDVPDDEVCDCGSQWAKPQQPKGLRRKTPLKQTSGLKRGGPMKRGSGLKRGAPIARTPAAAKKATPKRERPGTDDIPLPVRRIVLARCKGRCEACGEDLGDGPTHMHHRKRRTRLNHTPDNIVALHPTCHVLAPQAVHQRPTWARERGLIVRSGADPATTPLLLADGRRVLLDPDGPTYLPAPAVAA
jgi:hypothetical protein